MRVSAMQLRGIMAHLKSFIVWSVLGIAVLIGLLIGAVATGNIPKDKEGGTDVQRS